MVAHKDREQVHGETIPAWRQWLVDNHRTADGVWLVSWKTRDRQVPDRLRGVRR